ncbi:WD40-repeat-containing domain protein, partial [Catenaria anguillulae PL171]
CYRHRPDIQANPFHQSWRPDLDSLLAALPTEQRSAVTAIWSTFAAASAPIRDLILLGLVDTCCMRQLTTLHRALEPAMKMDVLTQLPVELSLRVLGYLDARSLCRASQVSKAWARLANCDSVWHRLCLQHIDKKCVKCGWALPLLTKKRKRSGPAAASNSTALSSSRSSTSSLIDHLATSPLPPTTLHVSSPGGNTGAAPLVRRSWKLIYAERLLIGRNWRSNTHAAYSLVPPTASLQPRVTACHLDEPYLMTSAMDGLVRLWHLESRTCLVTLAGHRGAVTSVHFDDAHGLAVSGGMDGTVRLWNWATGQCVRTLTGGHAVPVTALSFDQGILATADAASLIRVWDFSARTCFALCHGNQCAVTRVALCRGSLVSAGEDGVVRMWDLNTRSCTRTF